MPATAPTQRDLAKELWLQGFTLGHISEQLGVKPGTVRVWSSRYKWNETGKPAVNTAQVLAYKEVAERLSNLTIVQAERLICCIRDSKLVGLKDVKEAATALAASYATARKALGLDDNQAPQHLHLHVLAREQMKPIESTPIIDVPAEPAPGPEQPTPEPADPASE